MVVDIFFGQGLTTEINGIPICIAYHKTTISQYH